MTNFAIYESFLGNIKIKYEDNYVTYLKKIDEEIFDYGIKSEFSDMVFNQVLEYFNASREVLDFPYILKGTDFQMKVWNALKDIPYGKTCTYKEVASIIGNEKASRAVGSANNKNPLCFIIPCHRVIGSNNKLVGYVGGLEMKEYLLEMEKRK